jgi:Flp pilus assembly protein TadG
MTRGARGLARSRFARHRRGATALEFALTAVPMLLMTMGIIEGGLLFWSWQVLESAAIDAARCAALNASSCKNPVTVPSNTANYAAKAAGVRGLTGVTASNVTVTTGAAAQALCGNTTVNVISVAFAYHFPAMAVVPLPTNLTASTCFPLQSSSP